MKISEVTDRIINDYCGISEEEASDLVEVMKPAALAYIRAYTGLTDEEIETHEDLTIAYLLLINDMYSQRDYTLSWQKQVNPTVDLILRSHAINYL